MEKQLRVLAIVLRRYLLAFKEMLRRLPLKSLILFISVQFLVILLAFVFFGLIPVNREVKHLSAKIQNQSGGVNLHNNGDQARIISEIKDSEHYEAFLKAKLELAKADSISLFIDLNDSLVFLKFKGVYLMKSKISKINLNKGLEKMPILLRDSLFSGPMIVESEVSSIEKFPIVVKKAPKDTTEASLMNSAPVLPRQTDVFFLFEFDSGVFIEISQQEEDLIGGGKAYRNYCRTKAKLFREKSSRALFNFDERGYNYRINIQLPREDARSIYRALPTKPQVIVRYNIQL